jgi:transcriptional antiterminator NusG
MRHEVFQFNSMSGVILMSKTVAGISGLVAPTEADQRRSQREGRVLRLARQQLRFAAKDFRGDSAHGARWFCLQVATGFDFTVEKLLSECSVEVLVPREKVTSVRRGRKLESERPYFSGYVLVRFVPSPEAFDGLRRQKNVFGFVAGLTGYLVVSDKEVKRFQQLTPSLISRMPTDKSICEGTKARITCGPFAGIDCVVLAVKWKREGRARVQIAYDGNCFEIADMPLAFLERL